MVLSRPAIFWLIILILSAPGRGRTAVDPVPGSLEACLQQALRGNDDLRTARAEYKAAGQRIRESGVLPDPRLTVQYYLRPVETRTGPQNASIALAQTLPWFGKLALQRQVSSHEQAMAAARLAAKELDVVRQVKETYIEYWFLGRSRRRVADNIELLRYLEEVARSRYTGGKSTYFDVLKIQIEQARSVETDQDLKDQVSPVRIRMNSLLGLEPERALPVPELLAPVTLKLTDQEILRRVRNHSPLLGETVQRIGKARTVRALADRDFYPDFTFSLKTILTGPASIGDPSDSGEDPLIAGLSINLPLYRDRRHGKVAEKEALLVAARARRDRILRQLIAETEQLLYQYREAGRRLALYRDDLLPKVNQQLEVAINGFQSGEATILELIDAQQSLLSFELAKSRALADRALAVARLESRAATTLADWTSRTRRRE